MQKTDQDHAPLNLSIYVLGSETYISVLVSISSAGFKGL
jgi:hypothetical protein